MNGTPAPEHSSVVALVHRDAGAAVRDAAAHTLSPYVAAARLETNLAPLRERLHLLARRRPDQLAVLADHWGTTPDPGEVTAALTRHAALLLVRRHAALTGDPPDELLPNAGDAHQHLMARQVVTAHAQSARRVHPPPR